MSANRSPSIQYLGVLPPGAAAEDEVEVEDEVQRRDHEQAEPDADAVPLWRTGCFLPKNP